MLILCKDDLISKELVDYEVTMFRVLDGSQPESILKNGYFITIVAVVQIIMVDVLMVISSIVNNPLAEFKYYSYCFAKECYGKTTMYNSNMVLY